MALHGKAHEARKAALRSLKPFGDPHRDGIHASAFPAGVRGATLSLGRMTEDRAEFADAILVYVVWSYRTPIAWVTDGGVVVNSMERYSATTTGHQTACRVHLGMERTRVDGQVA